MTPSLSVGLSSLHALIGGFVYGAGKGMALF